MIDYKWKILEVFPEAVGVKYLISADDGQNVVESEGNHMFSDAVVNVPFNQIKEEELLRWIDVDTTQNDVNPIKLNLEKQLNALKTSQKVELPWLAGTFTI